jgi:hypothetical protein
MDEIKKTIQDMKEEINRDMETTQYSKWLLQLKAWWTARSKLKIEYQEQKTKYRN